MFAIKRIVSPPCLPFCYKREGISTTRTKTGRTIEQDSDYAIHPHSIDHPRFSIMVAHSFNWSATGTRNTPRSFILFPSPIPIYSNPPTHYWPKIPCLQQLPPLSSQSQSQIVTQHSFEMCTKTEDNLHTQICVHNEVHCQCCQYLTTLSPQSTAQTLSLT